MSDADFNALLVKSTPVPWSKDVATVGSENASVRGGTERLILATLKAKALPTAPADRAAVAHDGAKLSDRHATVADTWTPGSVARATTDNDAYVAFMAQHPEVYTFDDVKLSLDTWNQIVMNEATASVVVTGTTQRHDSSGWVDEGAHQWRVNLAVDRGNWKIDSMQVLLGSDYGY